MAAGLHENFANQEAEMDYEPKTGLIEDVRGAIMVFGLFCSVFLVGCVWYMVSVSTVLMQREGLQHTADASAFGSAVVSAKSMNLISSINVLMAGMSSILMPVRAMKQPYEHTKQIHAALCSPFNVCSCQIEADAMRAGTQLAGITQSLEQQAKMIFRSLGDAQDQIAKQGPKLAQQAAINLAMENRAFLKTPTAQLFSPSLSPEGCKLGLPVQEDTWKTACKRGKPYATEFEQRIAGPTLQSMSGACVSGPQSLAEAMGQASGIDNQHCDEARQPACSGGGGGGGSPHPKKVYTKAKNGNDYMQFWTKVEGKEFDNQPRRGVEVGAYQKSGKSVQESSNIGFAQSEIYFDCTGSFSGNSCNGDEHAMWSARWTARLRRIKQPTIGFQGDSIVKTELTDPQKWNSMRNTMLSGRNSPWGRGNTDAANLLRSSQEGPLQ